MSRWSGRQRNCAKPRNSIIKPKVVKICDSIGAQSIRRITTWKTRTPRANSRTAVAGSVTTGSSRHSATPQKLVYMPLRASPEDTDVTVRFEVRQLRGRDPVQVSYRLYKAADGWKVYDVNVLGVWLVETYKSSFSSEIARTGIRISR